MAPHTRLSFALVAACAAILLAPSPARADTIDFAGQSHGRIITTQFSGVTISANNETRGLSIAAIFDTTKTSTSDPDLEDPFSDAGNLDGDTFMGNALILAENNTGAGDGVLDDPDDEGTRRTDGKNWIQLVFATAVTELGWDVIDLEYGSAQKSWVVFTDSSGDTATVYYDNGTSSDLQTLASLGYGDNSLNRIGAISAAYLGLDDIQSARFIIGGSMAIDNVTFTPVPEPGTLALLACGLGYLVLRRRRAAA